MSTPNDDEVPAKDISDMIQITNEMAFAGDIEDEEDAQEDCLFPNCPIDPSLLESTTTSIKGAIDEHVVPKVDSTTKSIVGAYEEHVAPKMDSTRQSITGVLEEHVVPKIDAAKEHSMRTVDSFTTESQRIFSEVQENSKKGMEEVQNFSQNLLENSKKGVDTVLENSKKGIDGVTAQAMAIVDEKVKPGYENLVEKSQEAVKSTAEECQTYAPCYMGTAPGWTGLTTNNAPTSPCHFVLLEASLRAFGRVVFCDNPVTGIFIWLGLLCASPLGAFCSLLSVLTANATAMYLDMDKETLKSGQYARNAILIGTGVVQSLAFDFPETGNLKSGVSILLFLSIALAPATVVVESMWMKKVPYPSLLFPFNLVLLTTLICAKVWNFAMATQIEFQGPGMLLDDAPSKFWIIESVLNGLSKIFFVDGSVAGFFILIGVLLCSRIVAASLVAGSFVSSFVLGYMVFEENHWYLNAGYAGCNPALVVAGIFFYLVPSWKLTGLAFFAIVATVIVQGAVDVVLGILGMSVSTSLGFCFTLMALFYMDLGSVFGNSEDYFIRTVPASELSTPEEYLKSMNVDLPTDSSSDEDDDVEKNVSNEETPLLA